MNQLDIFGGIQVAPSRQQYSIVAHDVGLTWSKVELLQNLSDTRCGLNTVDNLIEYKGRYTFNIRAIA